jgi:hypothetical protein
MEVISLNLSPGASGARAQLLLSILARRDERAGAIEPSCVDAAAALDVPYLPTALSGAEWDVLFNAVKSRLRLAVVEGLESAGGQQVPSAAVGHAFSSVLECVEALDQLHVMLGAERGGPAERR